MFLIMGISQKEKKMHFDQLILCKCCGKYGHIEVFMIYSYFMLFFIPIIKWNKSYYVRMNCCGTTCELDPELGKKIENGEEVLLDENILDFGKIRSDVKHCSYCGFKTTEDFQFCPKCGRTM